MHVCIHVLVREYTCMQVHTHVEAREMNLEFFPWSFSALSLRLELTFSD